MPLIARYCLPLIARAHPQELPQLSPCRRRHWAEDEGFRSARRVLDAQVVVGQCLALNMEVWLFAHRVGSLALVDGRLNFRYAQEWLSQPDAIALSISLPLQAQPFDDRQARPF